MIKKIFKHIVFYVLLIVFIIPTSTGAEPISHYRKVFSVFGFDADIITQELLNTPNVVSYPKLKSTNLLLLTSQLNVLPENYIDSAPYTTVIVLCDKDHVLADVYSCSSNLVQSPTYKLLDIGQTNDGKALTILNTIHKEKRVIVVPQQYIVSIVYSDVLRDYFKAISYSYSILDRDSVSTDAVDIDVGLDPDLKQAVIYFLIGVLCILAIGTFVKTLLINPKVLFDKHLYYDFLTNLVLRLSSFRAIYLHIFIASIVFSGLLFVLSAGDNPNAYESEYINTYFLDRLTFLDTTTKIDDRTYVNSIQLVSSMSIWLIIVSLFMLLLQNIILAFQTVFYEYLLVKRPMNNILKLLTVSSSLGLVYVLCDFSIESRLVYIVILIIVLGYVHFVSLSNQRNSYTMFTRKERILMTILLIAVIAFKFLAYNPKYTIVPLFQGRYITLPQVVSTKVGYHPYEVSPTFPILINNYLVYYPGVKTIQNSFIREFSQNETFVILARSPSGLLGEVIKNPSLKNWLESNLPVSKSTAFFTSDLNHNFEPLSLEISYVCHNPYQSSRYTLDIYNDQNVHVYKDMNPLDVFNFPGCEVGDTGHFILPLGLDYLPSGTLGFDLHADELTDPVVDMQVSLIKGDKYVTTYGIPLYSNRRIFLSQKVTETNTPESITFYATGILSEARFTYESASEFDLSTPLNSLINQKILFDDATIWSLDEGEILNSIYLK